MNSRRNKRNKNNKTVSTAGYIEKYFGTEIGRILMPSNINLQNCEIPYVSHPEAEVSLANCLVGDPYKDKTLVFTGLTGSGKTTILRHVFGVEKNASMPQIQKDTIVIPVDFNRSQKTAQDGILSSLRAAIFQIVDTYGIDFPDIKNKKFFEYIKERRPSLLYSDAKHGYSTPFVEMMNSFVEGMPTAFSSCQLQYVMDCVNNKLKMAVLIVDNVEAFMDSNVKNDSSRYLAPVVEAFKLAECIKQRGSETKWHFNMLIACRHHIWRIMKGEYSNDSAGSALLQSYVTTETPYDLQKPVEIDSIIKRREEIFSRKQRDKVKWDIAVYVVNAVFQTMENNIGDFVMQLELKDIRKSMSKMQEIILHRGLQKESDEKIVGAFSIDSIAQFDLTTVNLIRVIGLGNQKYYSESNSIIPNLLYNQQEEGMELLPLLTLKYFLIQCGFKEPDWDNSVSVTYFFEEINFIFHNNEKVETRFRHAIQHLIQHRLLLRSADQPQNEVPGLSLEEVRKIEYVYVSGAAVKLWEELGKSSALFQLFLDDVWIDESLDYFSKNGNDVEHCVMYLGFLEEKEKKIFNNAQNISIMAKERYFKAFGTTSICKHLVDGLVTSLEAISTSDDAVSSSRIFKAKATLRRAQTLSNTLVEWEKERKK